MEKYIEGVRVIVDNKRVGTITKILEREEPTYIVQFGNGEKELVDITRLNRLYGSN